MIFKLFFLIVGFLLLINTVFLSVIISVNAGIIIAAIISIAFLVYGVFYKKINHWSRRGVKLFIRLMFYVGILAMAGIIAFLASFGLENNVTYKEDAIVVLGAGIKGTRITLPLQYRLDSAIDYLSKNDEALIVVSGGQGPGELISEAAAMESYLLRNGIEESRIIKEDRSTSTLENMRFSKELLDEKLGEDYTVAVTTNTFHIYRASRYAEMVGFDATHLNAKINWYTIPNNYIRECFAVLKLWILGG